MGKFIEKNLLPSETIIHKSKLHWAIYLKSGLSVLIGIGLLFEPFIHNPISIPASTLFLYLGLFFLIKNFLRSTTTEFALTDKRVVTKKGIFSRLVQELKIEQIEGVNIYQSFLGRILGYGTIHVTGTGGKTEPLPMIANPEVMHQAIRAKTQ